MQTQIINNSVAFMHLILTFHWNQQRKKNRSKFIFHESEYTLMWLQRNLQSAEEI